jgi:predicted MFS family arabinose efflux permease
MLLVRRAFGGEVDPRVWPVVAVTLAYNLSFSTFWVLLGVFAVRGLGWAPASVGLLFLASSPTAAVANLASGRLSDRFGRRRLIVASFLAASAIVAALVPARGHDPLPAVLVILLGMAGAPALTLGQVVVADVVSTEDEREEAYATVRLAGNLGALAGPPAAALVIATAGWSALLAAIAAVGLAGAAIAVWMLPETHAAGERDGAPDAFRRLAGNRPFLLLALSTLLGFTVYCGFETVLPVIAVSDYGVPAATWGLLLAISPAMVVLFQLRLTRAAGGVPEATRLAAAMALMGLPLLTLGAAASVPVIAAVIAVFVVGEMLWIPTSQAVAARLAPAPLRGTYFGVLSATTGPAWTLAPFVALQVESRAGPGLVWLTFAVVALAGAAAGVAAIRAAAGAGSRSSFSSGRLPGAR